MKKMMSALAFVALAFAGCRQKDVRDFTINVPALSQESEGAVRYVTHGDPAETYYYSISGPALTGNFLNQQTVDGERIATNGKHTVTYDDYSAESVNRYAEPIYWQTVNAIPADIHGDFVRYFILRVYTNDKGSNDRETDVLCIAAKSFTISSP